MQLRFQQKKSKKPFVKIICSSFGITHLSVTVIIYFIYIIYFKYQWFSNFFVA